MSTGLSKAGWFSVIFVGGGGGGGAIGKNTEKCRRTVVVILGWIVKLVMDRMD